MRVIRILWVPEGCRCRFIGNILEMPGTFSMKVPNRPPWVSLFGYIPQGLAAQPLVFHCRLKSFIAREKGHGDNCVDGVDGIDGVYGVAYASFLERKYRKCLSH